MISDMVCEGRPLDSGRLEKEYRTYDLLDQLEITYQRIDHDETASVESCHEVDKKLGISIYKNLFLCNSQRTKFYLLVMPGEKRFDTKIISKQLEIARLSFAGEEYMEEYLDITPGSVSILGLMNDKNNVIQLLLDHDLLEKEYFGCHPCINTSSLKIRTKDIINKFLMFTGHEPIYVKL